MNTDQMQMAEALVQKNPTLRLHEEGLILHETRHGIARLIGDVWVASREGAYLRALGRVRQFQIPAEACTALGFSLID